MGHKCGEAASPSAATPRPLNKGVAHRSVCPFWGLLRCSLTGQRVEVLPPVVVAPEAVDLVIVMAFHKRPGHRCVCRPVWCQPWFSMLDHAQLCTRGRTGTSCGQAGERCIIKFGGAPPPAAPVSLRIPSFLHPLLLSLPRLLSRPPSAPPAPCPLPPASATSTSSVCQTHGEPRRARPGGNSCTYSTASVATYIILGLSIVDITPRPKP